MKIKLYEAINYELYKDKLSKDHFDNLVGLDPFKNKPYAQWIVRMYLKDKETFLAKVNEHYLNDEKEDMAEDGINVLFK